MLKITMKQVNNLMIESLFIKGGTITETKKAIQILMRKYPKATLSKTVKEQYQWTK